MAYLFTRSEENVLYVNDAYTLSVEVEAQVGDSNDTVAITDYNGVTCELLLPILDTKVYTVHSTGFIFYLADRHTLVVDFGNVHYWYIDADVLTLVNKNGIHAVYSIDEDFTIDFLS